MKTTCREHLAFLQTVIDTLPAPVYYKDAAGRYLGCNRAFEQVHGLSREELLGRSVADFAAPELAAQIAAEDDELLRQQTGGFQVLEKTLTYADGAAHEVILYKNVFYREDGSPGGLVGSIIDITQRKQAEAALAEQKDFAESLLQNSAVACFVLDREHRVRIWTRACEELSGIGAAAVVGTAGHWKAFYPQPRPCLADIIIDRNLGEVLFLYDYFANSQFNPEGLQAEGWYPDVGGKRRYLFFEAAPIRDGRGEVVAAVETLHDLTHLKRMEEALRESEESYRSLIEHSPDAILVHRGGETIFANLAAARLFGAATPEKLAGAAVMELVHPEFRELVRRRITEAEQEGIEQPYVEERILRLDGSAVDVEAGSIAVFYRGERAVQTILRDITERKGLQERIWRQANFDPLTGIPNRLLFLDRLQQALDRAEREKYHVALLYLDLDRFKEVNDTLGHEAGDALLREVARRLTAVLRRTDTLARMGGDEFTLIMPRIVEPPTVSAVARRILQQLAEPFDLPGGKGHISGSIGIAFFPEDGEDISALLQHADAAMYRAKEGGRNTFTFFSPGRVVRDAPEQA